MCSLYGGLDIEMCDFHFRQVIEMCGSLGLDPVEMCRTGGYVYSLSFRGSAVHFLTCGPKRQHEMHKVPDFRGQRAETKTFCSLREAAPLLCPFPGSAEKAAPGLRSCAQFRLTFFVQCV
jgi:hypothetical protein